jgi:hypothetical protein
MQNAECRTAFCLLHSAFCILTSALAVCALAAPTWAQPKTTAWDRWGITKPAPAAAESGLVAACSLLYASKYDSARQVYADLVRDYPNSAEAHLGLSLAERYVSNREHGGGLRDSALAEARTAVTLDPEGAGPLCNYSDLLEPLRGGYASEKMSYRARLDSAIEVARKAAATGHRYSTYAHVALWIDYLSDGRLSDARQEMRILGQQDYFPPMLLDFGRNVLSGLPPDAILFTNGDNDTEPLLCLQATEGFRPDVTVVNLTFLMLPRTVAVMRDSLSLPISFSDSELDQILSQPDSAAGHTPVRFARIRDNVIANALKQNRPVYFAATVNAPSMGDWQYHLIGEGLVWRVVSAKTDDTTDAPRMLANVKSWRMAAAEQEVDWPANMSPMLRNITELKTNYMVVYMALAKYYYAQSDTAGVDQMCRSAYGLTGHLSNPVLAGRIVKIWLNLNPNSVEAKELSKKYE